MIKTLREKYNANFKEENYNNFLAEFEKVYGEKIDFRVAESPLFVSKEFFGHLKKATDDIMQVIQKDNFKELTKNSIPAHQNVPNESSHPEFLVIDFALSKNESDEYVPQLIELQGFPSLYGFQEVACQMYRKHFEISDTLTHILGERTPEQYYQYLSEVIFGGHQKENVILLEIEPHKQKTRIDFQVMKQKLDLDSICISKIILEGKKLFYEKDGKKIEIKRIYNRVIFDELEKRTDLNLQFNMTQEVEVEWAGHPNWFFRISKYTVPFLESRYVPKSYFLNEVRQIPQDLENYVLKPLFSFAGEGVIFDVKLEDITKIPDERRKYYLLQKKVKYAEVFKCPKGEPVKAEIRLLFLWKKENAQPELMLGLARLSKGVMIGVNFNKDRDWVGGSGAFFEK
ncbi:MAG: hypothetical protein EAZ85_09270 [Bacteroidetes bacterium]|nr:MAG: hypothetical protein EAZ85_09270 [Bacteroidota bacterium]TAG90857.1 MAG: hypothetical protein EAZ20_03615 [Bacteroidota bacterium]